MQAGHRDFLLVRKAAAEIAGTPDQKRARLGVDEEFGLRAFEKPLSILLDDGDNVRRLRKGRRYTFISLSLKGRITSFGSSTSMKKFSSRIICSPFSERRSRKN